MTSSLAMMVIALLLVSGAGAGNRCSGGDRRVGPDQRRAGGQLLPAGVQLRAGDADRCWCAGRRSWRWWRPEELALVEVVAGSVQAAGAGNNYRLLLRAADVRRGAVRSVWGVPRSTSFKRVAGN
uniref:Cysteine proteinase inhibitor n=1 Tax=Oryza brachyantha TaxID=4533 RepID=J3LBR1_ORYBR